MRKFLKKHRWARRALIVAGLACMVAAALIDLVVYLWRASEVWYVMADLARNWSR